MKLSDVFLQVEVATESLVTELTCEWLLIVVCVHVESQIVHLKNMNNILGFKPGFFALFKIANFANN